jgi:hypothetical protein
MRSAYQALGFDRPGNGNICRPSGDSSGGYGWPLLLPDSVPTARRLAICQSSAKSSEGPALQLKEVHCLPSAGHIVYCIEKPLPLGEIFSPSSNKIDAKGQR